MSTFVIPFCLNCNQVKNGRFCNFCGTALSEGENIYVRPEIGTCRQSGYADVWPHERYCRDCGTPQRGIVKALKCLTSPQSAEKNWFRRIIAFGDGDTVY